VCWKGFGGGPEKNLKKWDERRIPILCAEYQRFERSEASRRGKCVEGAESGKRGRRTINPLAGKRDVGTKNLLPHSQSPVGPKGQMH